MRRYASDMVRRTRIVVAASATAVGILTGAALAPAAGDRYVSGASSERVSYTKDGIPYVNSGPECKAGHAGAKKHRSRTADPTDY